MRVLCVVLAVLLLFSLASPGYGQPKGFCGGYCSYTCAKRDEWSFSQSCGKMFCCIPPPEKGK
ncbi:small basic protein 1-like [Apus apus]|uniref:small basic protein 1-like n=1 Tax=Apus apus TaxID=8895 RepID=UPI0021F866DA|nr:small basic protein 1-like [Apus apus]